MPPYISTNSEIEKYYQKEPIFNWVYLKSNLPKIKGKEYGINLDDYKSITTRCMWMVIIWHNLVALELKLFQKKLKNLWTIKISQQNF